MPEVFHGHLRPAVGGGVVSSGIHVVHDWEVANAATRNGLGVTAAMVGKICRQVDDASFWILATVTPSAEWRRLDGATSATGAIHTWTVDSGEFDGSVSSALASLDVDPEDDLGKVAWVTDRNRFFILYVNEDDNPAWLEIAIGDLTALANTVSDHTGTLGTHGTRLSALEAATPYPGPSGIITTTAPQSVDGGAAIAGTVASGAAPNNHKHQVTTAAPVAIGGTGSALAAGTGTALALAAHVHTLAAADRTALDTTLPAKADKLFTVITFTGNRTLALTDNNAILSAIGPGTAGEQIVTIPTDAQLNLPIGFNVTLVATNINEAAFLPAVDFYPTPMAGTPNFIAFREDSLSIDPTTTRGGALTAVKLGANLWRISGDFINS